MNTPSHTLSIWENNSDKPVTILFLHGHCTNKSFFAAQMNADELKDYRRIAIDLPGYGESAAPINPQQTYNFPGFADAVANVIQQLNIQELIIVGWSLGGHVALELISRLPQIKGLLLTGTPPIEVSLAGIQQGFRAFDPEIMACFGKKDLSYEEAKLLATVSGYDGSKEKEFIVTAILDTDEGAREIYPASIVKNIGRDQRGIVAECDLPIAIVAGEHDFAINYDYVRNEVKFKNLWRNKIQTITNAGHAVMLDQPAAFNQLIKSFADDICQ